AEWGEVPGEVVAAGQDGVRGIGQAVSVGLVHGQEKSVEAAVDGVVAAVELSLGDALRVEGGQARVRSLLQLRQRPELDRLGRTGFGTGRLHAALQAVVAHGALVRRAGRLVHADHAVRAGRDAVAAAVADVLLDEDRVELGADDGAGRANLHAARVLAVLADVGHHQPSRPVARAGRAVWNLVVELHVPPVLGVELARVVVAVGQERRLVALELVPLLASGLARLAPDADAGVGEEPV